MLVNGENRTSDVLDIWDKLVSNKIVWSLINSTSDHTFTFVKCWQPYGHRLGAWINIPPNSALDIGTDNTDGHTGNSSELENEEIGGDSEIAVIPGLNRGGVIYRLGKGMYLVLAWNDHKAANPLTGKPQYVFELFTTQAAAEASMNTLMTFSTSGAWSSKAKDISGAHSFNIEFIAKQRFLFFVSPNEEPFDLEIVGSPETIYASMGGTLSTISGSYSNHSLPNASHNGFVKFLKIGDILYCTAQGAQGIYTYNINSATNPAPMADDQSDQFTSVTNNDNVLYVTPKGTTKKGIWSFDLDNPGNGFNKDVLPSADDNLEFSCVTYINGSLYFLPSSSSTVNGVYSWLLNQSKRQGSDKSIVSGTSNHHWTSICRDENNDLRFFLTRASGGIYSKYIGNSNEPIVLLGTENINFNNVCYGFGDVLYATSEVTSGQNTQTKLYVYFLGNNNSLLLLKTFTGTISCLQVDIEWDHMLSNNGSTLFERAELKD